MGDCYDCFRSFSPSTLGKATTIGAPEKKIWVCFDCARCVVCGMKGGNDVNRAASLNFNQLIPAVVFSCKEHERMMLDTNGLRIDQMPKPLLEHFLEFLAYQRSMLISKDTQPAMERLKLVNGLMSQIKETTVGAALGGAEPTQSGPLGGVVIKETVKEIVKIPCRYCGNLVVNTDSKCPSCGAPLR